MSKDLWDGIGSVNHLCESSNAPYFCEGFCTEYETKSSPTKVHIFPLYVDLFSRFQEEEQVVISSGSLKRQAVSLKKTCYIVAKLPTYIINSIY